MKTAIEMAQDGYIALNEMPDVKPLLKGGDIYLFERPADSKMIDIVVNSLALTTERLQQGVFNINIHAPNLSISINDRVDNSMPDIKSLLAISKIIAIKFADLRGYDFRMTALTAGLAIKDQVSGQWYVNIRVSYTSVQKTYSII